jgi:hypothetical protein
MKVIVNQIEDTQPQIAGLERQLLEWHKNNPVSQRLATILGIGPIIAPAIAATVADPNIFRSGREFAAWLGLNTGAPRPIGSTPSCSNALFFAPSNLLALSAVLCVAILFLRPRTGRIVVALSGIAFAIAIRTAR